MANVRPLVLELDGILGRMLDGDSINAGGTTHNTWTVGGRGVLFDDGTSSAPLGSSSLSLQRIYDLTTSVGGEAAIKLSLGKDFILKDDTDDGIYFKVDAETGKVTITGDLEVLGGSTVIESVIQDSDHWLISPAGPAQTALKIEPNIGVTPLVDLISVRRTFGSAPVLRLDKDGNLLLSQNVQVGGLLNGINLTTFKAAFDLHLANTVGGYHIASDIPIATIASISSAMDVQDALEQINAKVDAINAGAGGASGAVNGFEYNQPTPSVSWIISHPLASSRAQVTVYDSAMEQIIPDTIRILDNSTILVSFGVAQAGSALVLAF